MNKSLRITAGALLLATLGWVGFRAMRPQPPPQPTAAPAPSALLPALVATESPATLLPPQPTVLSDMEKVLAGGPVPALPSGTPDRVRFGAILFTYRGAELVGSSARPKEEALKLARAIVPKAVDDFAEAVKHGDPGSSADVGEVPRGVLEAPVEYVIFTLDKRKVFEQPIDTPRGYWVVKRLQ